MIHFEPDTCRIRHGGESLQLLPKEFVLLRYLHENAGRSFSREQLLNAVWPMEAPVDRTVDDHVYRLRKKTAGWSHLFRLETVRGKGYKLTLAPSAPGERPLLSDGQFAADVGRLFSKYHSLGMGAAMQLLSEHRDILSLPEDPYYDAYVRFVRGDFRSLLEAENVDPSQKAAYAAFILSFVEENPGVPLSYIERLTAAKGRLTPDWIADLKSEAVSLYLEAGLPDRARATLNGLGPIVAGLESPSFTAVFLLKQACLSIREIRLDDALAQLLECEELLNRHPILRERGAYLVCKASFLYRRREIAAARESLDEGIETTKRTRFVPHLLGCLRLILRYFRTDDADPAYREKYRRQWDALSERYRLDELPELAAKVLERSL